MLLVSPFDPGGYYSGLSTNGDNISCVRTRNVLRCKDSEWKRIVDGNFSILLKFFLFFNFNLINFFI